MDSNLRLGSSKLCPNLCLILVNTEPNMYKLHSARSDILKSKNSSVFLCEGLVVGWSVCDTSQHHSALICGAKESKVPEVPDFQQQHSDDFISCLITTACRPDYSQVLPYQPPQKILSPAHLGNPVLCFIIIHSKHYKITYRDYEANIVGV